MTTVTRPRDPQTQQRRSSVRRIPWVSRHLTSLCIMGPLLIAVSAANAWNLQGWPLYIDEDEGTYVSEAWAVIQPQHHLAPYTYWYDHPPLGWILMGGYFWITDALHRYPAALMAGREFMWVVNVVACGLLYILARRMTMSRPASAVAVLLFGLSPLAMDFHRRVFLDNIAVAWMLAALALALSPRKSIGAALCSAVCFSAAVLSKETLLLILPVWLWIVWRNSDDRRRAFWLSCWIFFFIVIIGYPLFAALRGELFPGKGHVSLIGAIQWQLLSRQSTGSLLDTHSGTYSRAVNWVHQDPWLLVGGLTLGIMAMFIRRLWPLVLALIIQVAFPLKGGYVPYAYVTAVLPFAALIVVGVADTWWQPLKRARHARTGSHPWTRQALTYAGRVPVIAGILVLAALVAPSWGRALVAQSHADAPANTLAAESWVEHNVPRGNVVVVDDDMLTDLTIHSRVRPVWVWKIDLDPAVMANTLPHGWRSIGYIVWDPEASSVELSELPTLRSALNHAVAVKRFGTEITIFKVLVSS
jgi:hypothetical protein